MKRMVKRFFFTLGVAAMMSTAPTAAHASPDSSSLDSCSSCSFAGLIAALNNLTVEITQLQLLNNLDVDNVYVVDVDDVFNGSALQLLYFNSVLNKNFVNVVALQSVLSDFKVIDNSEGTLIDFEDFLNDADIDISDVVAVDALSDNKLVVFHK